ncbi:ATP-binding protein [Streptomyces sp. NPDC057743]|uniref:AAA family ATPase n=1 Tax=Streptomyces sp. NPDC057743 TaxID=3346236 RepID=UPI00369F20A7
MNATPYRPRTAPPPEEPVTHHATYLHARLHLLEDRLRLALAPGGVAAKEFTARHDQIEQKADAAEAATGPLRLRDLARRLTLSEADTDLLLLALLPHLSPLLVTRPAPHDISWATPALAHTLWNTEEPHPALHHLLDGSSPLLACGALAPLPDDIPLPHRPLRATDHTVAYLLGSDALPPDLANCAAWHPSAPPRPLRPAEATTATHLRTALTTQAQFLYLNADCCCDTDGILAAATQPARALRADPAALARTPDPDRAAHLLHNLAHLHGVPLLLGPFNTPQTTWPTPLTPTSDATTGTPPLLGWGTQPRPPGTTPPPLLLTAPAPSHTDRLTTWQHILEHAAYPQATDHAARMSAYRLSPTHIHTTVTTALAHAHAHHTTPALHHLTHAAAHHNADGLTTLARRITPTVTWNDLILPDPTTAQIKDLTLRARHRHRVLGEWALRPGHGRGWGIAALLAGESGTGKTLAAEVIAADLGMDLYTVNLATVLDKYIGETEKHLDALFTEASGINGILLFDEADAVFGKRTETKDAHDRHANTQISYLLQRLEAFDGFTLLTSNLTGNIDTAFTRRLDHIIHFPLPTETERLALWDLCIGPHTPRAPHLDLPYIATSFPLPGGSIRNAATNAAYRAAHTNRPLNTADLITGIKIEYRKTGRLIHDDSTAQST